MDCLTCTCPTTLFHERRSLTSTLFCDVVVYNRVGVQTKLTRHVAVLKDEVRRVQQNAKARFKSLRFDEVRPLATKMYLAHLTSTDVELLIYSCF